MDLLFNQNVLYGDCLQGRGSLQGQLPLGARWIIPAKEEKKYKTVKNNMACGKPREEMAGLKSFQIPISKTNRISEITS